MLNKPTILAVTLAPMKEALLSYGSDFDALTRQAGIDPDVEGTSDRSLLDADVT